MKKTNKFFAIIAVLALVLIVCVSFVACNNKEDVGTVKKVVGKIRCRRCGGGNVAFRRTG